jgi:hypothetical protein
MHSHGAALHAQTTCSASRREGHASNNVGYAGYCAMGWDARLKQKGQDLRTIDQKINRSLQGVTQAFAFASLPPPIQGIVTSVASL